MVSNKSPLSLAAKISLPYLILGILYISLSDRVTTYLVGNSDVVESLTTIQTIKGWAFIFLTAGILHLLVYRFIKSLSRTRTDLVEQEGKYHSLFQGAPVSIWVVDFSNVRTAIQSQLERGVADPHKYWSEHMDEFRDLIHASKIKNVNSATLALFAADSASRLNDEIAYVLSEESCETILGIIFDLFAGKEPTIWEMQVRSLSQKDLTVLMSLTFPPGVEFTWTEVHLMMLDITAQKAVATELENSHRQLLEAQRIAQTGSWEWIFATNQINWSGQAYSIFGISEDDFEGSYDAYLNMVHSEDRHNLELSLNELRQTGRGQTEPYRILRPCGEIRYVVTRGETVYDKQGRAVSMIGLVQDVTDRHREEQERTQLENQLRQTQKLESLGALAGGIAHDFNNILTPLYGYTELVMQDLDPNSRTHEDLSHVMKAATRGKELVHQILAFSRQIEQERKPVLLHHIVNEVVKLLRASVPPTIEITKSCEAEIDAVIADPVQLHQVVMNLCVNACYAMRERGGKLELHIDIQDFDESQSALSSECQPGRFVRLRVTDNGVGMDAETQQRAFEPFFTTKPEGEGTGLGLSVSRQIITSHKGTITVDSCAGKGTTFTILLPRTQSESSDAVAMSLSPSRGQGRILFVDDEIEIAGLAKQMLSRLGYEVETALNYDQAMHVIANSQDFDILITDQLMPGKSGVQLAMDLRARKFETPIVLLTGDGISFSDEVAQRCGIDAFLSKPFSGFELSQVIRRVFTNSRVLAAN